MWHGALRWSTSSGSDSKAKEEVMLCPRRPHGAVQKSLCSTTVGTSCIGAHVAKKVDLFSANFESGH